MAPPCFTGHVVTGVKTPLHPTDPKLSVTREIYWLVVSSCESKTDKKKTKNG